MSTAIGTVKAIFGRQFVYTDPQYIQGLGLWRDINVAPPASDFSTIDALLPIRASEVINNTTINLSFDINNLPEITSARNTTTFLGAAAKVRSYNSSPAAPTISVINTIAPVRSVSTKDTAVLYFDITALSYLNLEETKAQYTRRIRAKANSYNSSRSGGPSLTATAPMVQDTEGSSATVSFDISDLNYA